MKDTKDKIIEVAKKEMKKLKHPYLDSSHLLLALFSFDESRSFLVSHDITYELVYDVIIKVIGKGSTEKNNSNFVFTPVADDILSDYTKLVKKFPSNSSLCMLLCVLRSNDGECLGSRILSQAGVDIDILYDDLDDLLSTSLDLILDKYKCLVDLNREVREDGTVITGLDEQLQQLCKYLLKIQKPNVIILGEPGVGKTALVEKLAVAINEKKVPPFLQNLRILQLSLGSAVAGTKYRGEFEEKINGIIDSLSNKSNVILFIDEIHTMVGAGGAEGAIDASNLFKPVLARGKIKLIGATTNAEYKEYICSDKAFARRFNTIELLETTKEETLNIMSRAKTKLEKHYSLKLSKDELEKIYSESTHRTGRMPDVALDALEEYCVDLYYKRESEKEEVNV